MADRLQKPVLVLNASYEPINICGARRALVLVLKGVASAEEETSHGRPFPARRPARCPRSSACSNTAASRTRRAPFRARTSSCATATPASIAIALCPPAN